MDPISSSLPANRAVVAKGFDAEAENLKKACREFETHLWDFMLRSVKFGESDGAASMMGGVYSGLVREEFAGALARTGSLGIGDIIFRSLTASREVITDEGDDLPEV